MPGVRAWVNEQVRECGPGRTTWWWTAGTWGRRCSPRRQLKVFLVADPWERARRRLVQRLGRAPTDDEVAEETERLVQRDAKDAAQTVAGARCGGDRYDLHDAGRAGGADRGAGQGRNSPRGRHFRRLTSRSVQTSLYDSARTAISRRWRSGTRCRHPQPRRGERPIREFWRFFNSYDRARYHHNRQSLTTLREKRDPQKAQLRPLANRRPELYEEDEYTSAEYEQMMEMYNGTLASIEEGEIVKCEGARDPRQPRRPRHRLQVRRHASRSRSSRTSPTSSRATKSRSSSSTSRTRKARSSCPRRRPTSCACGSASAWRTRPTSRSKAR